MKLLRKLTGILAFCRTENGIVMFIVLFFFLLQVRYLHLATNSITDEGVYAQAGRMMWSGLMPHRDFPLWHMPLLPFLIGLGLKIFGSIYVLRVLFLLVNCLMAIPLFVTLKHLNKNTAGAIFAILFYLTFHEMVHHDFRLLAIRQVSNAIFILYFYVGIVQRKWKWATAVQIGLAATSALLFLPSTINLFFLSGALILMRERKEMMNECGRYLAVAIGILATVLCYFLFIPESIDQSIFSQVARSTISWHVRWSMLFSGKFDAFFYTLSLLSLTLGILAQKNLRWLSLAMVAIFFASGFLPKAYFPHYLSIAGPALAFGIFVFALLLERISALFRSEERLVFYTTLILVFAYHFGLVFPSLITEWYGNKQPAYREFIHSLSIAPNPVLALEPVFAVEADRTLLLAPIAHALRPPIFIPPPNMDDWATMEKEACTILMETHLRSILPERIRLRWESTFKIHSVSRWGVVLLTQNAFCPPALLQTEQTNEEGSGTNGERD